MKISFKKKPNIMEQFQSNVKTVRRMTQENLDAIYPIETIVEKYKDKIYYVDYSITGADIGVKESNFCVIPEIESDLCKLGFKLERTKYPSYSENDNEGKYHIRISTMRYLAWGEVE